MSHKSKAIHQLVDPDSPIDPRAQTAGQGQAQETLTSEGDAPACDPTDDTHTAPQPWQEMPYEFSPLENCPPIARYLASLTYDKHGLAVAAAKGRVYWRSVGTAVISVRRGKYDRDRATIEFNAETGEVTVCVDGFDPADIAPDPATKDEIRKAITERPLRLPVPTPHPVGLVQLPGGPWTEGRVKPMEVYPHRLPDGRISMVVARFEEEDGGKRYVPYSYYDDGKWRLGEPGGKLLPFGLEQLSHEGVVVFIHEGQKAARGGRELADYENGRELTRSERERIQARKIPAQFREYFSSGTHIGWHGGAHAVLRTDWSWLQKLGVKKAYVVTDNDREGKRAIQKLSKALSGIAVAWLRLEGRWPESYDFADDFPETLYLSDKQGAQHYSGPTPYDLLQPATWATHLIVGANGKVDFALNSAFTTEYVYVKNLDIYVSRYNPRERYGARHFNRAVAPYSDTADVARLLAQQPDTHVDGLAYRPGLPDEIAVEGRGHCLNTFRAPRVAPADGCDRPWRNYLKQLIPVEKDRSELERWCATMIARPDIRMIYGVLLASSQTGTGKSTLGYLLARLVGRSNVSHPTGETIIEGRNTWVAEKRLAVIEELYEGHKFTVANKLKPIMTQPDVRVNEKNVKSYDDFNCVQVLATSNHERAIRIDNTERRWLVPRVTSKKNWSKAQWDEFYSWLSRDGLGIILQWAADFEKCGGRYVTIGELAPSTAAKQELIIDSLSDAQTLALDLAERLAQQSEPVAVSVRFVAEQFIAKVRQFGGRANDSMHDVKRAMMMADGVHVTEERIKIGTKLDYIAYNAPAAARLAELGGVEVKAGKEWLRERLRMGQQIVGSVADTEAM